jgi:penicillin-binding protein 1A
MGYVIVRPPFSLACKAPGLRLAAVLRDSRVSIYLLAKLVLELLHDWPRAGYPLRNQRRGPVGGDGMSTLRPSREGAPAGVSPATCPYCGAPRRDLGGLDWAAPGSGRSRVRRLMRRARRLLVMAVVLGLLGGIMVAGLLIVAPSVANAPALARALDQAHHAAYPGPPVPGRFSAALVATEDHRFYSEAGIDPFAIPRVAAGYLMGKPDQGGATLYQQLAKLLYTPGPSGILAKGEQVLLGVKLALSYPKAEIMRMYADVAYFGQGYYGLQAASCGYFRVPPAALTWPQAAVLAGLVQAPSADGALVHLPAARVREAHVLGRLAATGILSSVEAERAYDQPLHLSAGHTRGCS